MPPSGGDREGRRFRIHGRVQGVGFRWWTRSLARRLGLAGSVRNLPDGTVEVRAAGPAAAISRLRTELAAGPPGATVERIEEEPDPGLASTEFEIAH